MSAAIAAFRLSGWGVDQDQDLDLTVATTFVNNTASDVVVEWCKLSLHWPELGLHWLDGPDVSRQVTVPPGAQLTVDPLAENAAHIYNAAVAAGLTPV